MSKSAEAKWFEGKYADAVESKITFECFDFISLTGYYIKNYPGRELEQLRADLSEGKVSSIKGCSVTAVLVLLFG